MSEPVRIFVGTDQFQQKSGAEQVLEYSIRKHATVPVEMHWMRSGDPGFEVSADGKDGSWKVWHDGTQAWPKRGWGTPFSCFRAAVPELAGFEGLAVYLDADMLVLGDIAELVNFPRRRPWLCNSTLITDVSVIDCAAFKDAKWWPRIAQMKPSGAYLHEYRTLLKMHDYVDGSLPWNWNCRDDCTADTRLVHFTAVPWQVWRPYPSVKYQEHPKPHLRQLFFNTLEEARAAAAGSGS